MEGSEDKFIGRTLDSRYCIESILEVGGMGTVYSGIHARLGRKIAVKILHEELIGDEVQSERFLREARAAAEIHHRNVVDVIDIGRTKEGLPYFVMELLKGEALKVRMKRLRIMAPSEIGWIVRHALAGLSVAHENGVIHRDVKPGNIFICREKDEEEIAKILDFGVAKFKFKSEQIHAKDLTTTGTILGTPYYMSPEQAMGKKAMVDSRSDIYSCGLIVYRGLTGKNPFRGENYNEVIYNILTRDIPPPSYLNGNIPDDIDRVVLKAVSRDPDERYQTCKEFIEALEEFDKYKLTDAYLREKRVAEEKGETAKDEAEDILDGDSSRILTGEASEEDMRGPQEAGPADEKRETSISHSQSVDTEAGRGKKRIYTAYVKVMIAAVVILVGFYAINAYVNRKGAADGTAGNKDTASLRGEASEATETISPGNGGVVESVSISLTGALPGSEITVDKVVHEEMPVVIDRSGSPVLLEVAKEGFATFEKEIIPEKDIDVFVQMEPVAGAGEEVEGEAEDSALASPHESGEKKKKKKKKKGKGSATKKIYTKLPGSK